MVAPTVKAILHELRLRIGDGIVDNQGNRIKRARYSTSIRCTGLFPLSVDGEGAARRASAEPREAKERDPVA